MDINGRFGMEFNPFLKNSREILVETTEYKEAVFRLNYRHVPKSQESSEEY